MKNNFQNHEKARILKDSLRIVDKLGTVEDVELELDLIEDLIKKSKKIKKSSQWKL